MWWNNYIGIPFKEKGRDETGADCWGLAKVIYQKEKSICLPSYLECYESTNDRDLLSQVIRDERNKWKDVKIPAMFDVVILNMRGVPMHVGIVTKPNHMIHCARGIGTVHERFDSLRWKNKVLGFSRYEQ